MKHIMPINKHNQRHGWWKQYYSNGNLAYKGNYINGIPDGCWVRYHQDGMLIYKEYHIQI